MRWIILAFLFILILTGAAALILVPAPNTASAPTQTSDTTQVPIMATSSSNTSVNASSTSLDDLIKVTSPLPGAQVTSPLVVSGSARGSWFFEASARTELRNATGTIIAQGPSTTLGDWTSPDFIPFSATLTFPTQPTGSYGTLVLMNDNPSGDPLKQKELDIPIKF